MDQTRRTTQQLFYAGIAVSLVLLLWGWWAGSAHLLTIPGGRLVALGRLFGLLATYTILLEVFLVSRVPFLEKNFDLHEMTDLHRWNGYGIVASIVAHTVFLTIGYAAPGHVGWWNQFWQFNTQYEDILYATIGTIVLLAATALSVRIMRKRLPYELWFATQLTLYGAIVLGTLHQLKTGGDFIGHFWFTSYWYMWYIGVFGLLAWYRFILPLLNAYRYEFRVAGVVQESATTYSVYVSGNGIEHFRFSPGQYATWWVLAPGIWWQAHPFSFSNPPGEEFLRFTVKASGDFTNAIRHLQPGSRVIIDGPRGSFITDRAANAKQVLLIAGGIGIAPYVSSIETFLDAHLPVALLYAASSKKEISFRRELAELQRQGLLVDIFLKEQGRRIDTDSLKQYITPGTVVYVCGPDGMSRGLSNALHKLGVPKSAIVTERFAY
ncbi:MAG TPA: ferric reductase-like transmembrane domain-containing protein [Patescibacteria group bacterium]|nr:ferric reductase-like transmembrane domain-containing protein [Patescibacteria group bacterium]